MTKYSYNVIPGSVLIKFKGKTGLVFFFKNDDKYKPFTLTMLWINEFQ